MNKKYAFFGIILTLFFVFACTMPSELEIKGAPSVRFAANMNFSDYFSDMLDGVLNTDGDTKILNCTSPSLTVKTFLLQMEIFKGDNLYEADEDEFTDGSNVTIQINGEDVNVNIDELGGDIKLTVSSQADIAKSDEPYKIPFSSLIDYLDGFKFTELKSKMYVYGSDIVGALNINIYKTDEEGNSPTLIMGPTSVVGKKSVVESLTEYTGNDLPNEGNDFIGGFDIKEIINNKEDLYITYEINIPAGRVIDLDWIKGNQIIVVEFVIWFPMALESTEPNARFKFPDFFDGISDVFKSLAGTGFIENMNIQIGIHPQNPFGNGIFVIEDEKYGPIKNPLDNNNFIFGFNKNDVDYVNKNPFDPSFYILFETVGTPMVIPNGDIMISTVSFNAELKYNMEF